MGSAGSKVTWCVWCCDERCIKSPPIASSPKKYHIMLPLMFTATAFDILGPDDWCWLDI